MNIKDSRYAACLYFTSAVLARKVEKLASDVWKAVDLPPSHSYLLMAVMDEPGIQPSKLSAELQLQPSTVTRLIDKLEEKKLVVRTYEGKLSKVYPTEEAIQLGPRMKKCVELFSQQYTGLLGEAESRRFVHDIVRFAGKLNS